MTRPPKYTEREPHEQGFAAVFARVVAPQLERYEVERVQRTASFYRRRAWLVGAALLIALVALPLALHVWLDRGGFKDPENVGLLIPLAPLAALWLGEKLLIAPLRARHRKATRELFFGAVLEHVDGLEYFAEPERRFQAARYQRLGLIPHGSFGTWEDLFVGRHRGLGFRMVETVVEKGWGFRKTPVFYGLLLELELPQRSRASVTISPKGSGGLLRRVTSRWREDLRVTLDDSKFAARFDVEARDADEARRLLTPAVRAGLSALAASSRKGFRAAFSGGKLLIALPTMGPSFEPMRDLARSFYDCENELHKLLREVTLPSRTIDELFPGAADGDPS